MLTEPMHLTPSRLPAPLHRFFALACLLPSVALAAPAQNANQPVSPAPNPTWDFTYTRPDATNPPALDLSFLNENTAGQHGFIALSPDGNNFVRGDGQPIRFWPVNEMELSFSDEELRHHARFLAQMGVNLCRYHVSINPKGKGTSLHDVDMETIRQVWRYVAAMKKEGIYAVISPFWPHDWFMGGWVPEEWGIDGYTGKISMWGVFYFNDRLREGYKSWVRALYTLTNPYTGLALRDDPALALIQIMNEDGVFWWSMDEYMTPGLHQHIVAKFLPWLEARYGSIDRARAAWGEARLPEDDPANGKLGLYSIRDLIHLRDPAAQTRLRDQTRFYAETQRAVYAEMRNFYREDLKCHQLINAMDWKAADATRLLDLERWTNTATDVLGTNIYFDAVHDGESNGWLVGPGHTYVGPSALLHPETLPVNVKQPDGHPFLIVESGWNSPQKHAAEGPFLIAAYESLTGVDGFTWFCVTAPDYATDPYVPKYGKPGEPAPMLKWTCSLPGMFAQFPASALIYRQGYLRQGAPVVSERRSFADLIDRTPTPISELRSYDPNRAEGALQGKIGSDSLITPLAFLAGPVITDLSADTSSVFVSPELSSLIDEKARTVRSITGEHLLDYGRGLCQIDSPRAKGICGFLSKQGHFSLDGLTLDSANEFAAVWVVSLDGAPLAESSRVLVQCGTRYLPTGWKEEPATFTYSLDKVVHQGFRVLDTGRMPWQADVTQVTLEITNPNLTRAVLLDTAGRPVRELTPSRTNGRLRLELPPEALYVILQR